MKIIKSHDNLFRSASPSKWEDIARMKKYGITTIINLQSVCIFDCVYFNNEEKLINEFNIKPIYIPMSLVMIPSLSQLNQVLEAIENASGNVLIHCKYGVDRTGITIAYFKIMKGILSFEEAVEEMLIHGFHKLWYFWWLPIFRKYLN